MSDVTPDLSLPEEAIASAIAAVVRLFVDPKARTFWPVLAVSIAVAFWLRHRERRDRAPLPAHLDLFSRLTWCSRSARHDYLLVVLNSVALSAVLIPRVLCAPQLAGGIADLLRALLPDPRATPGPWAPVLLAATLFVADDLARYVAHRLEHQVPALWELHKVHHSAQVLDFVTAERHHPGALLFEATILAATAAKVNGGFLWLFRDAITPAALLGANVFWLAGNLLASSLRHSPVWLSFGPRIERWLLSPAQHQIHHSEDPSHFGTNLGSTLAIWDRLSGALHVTTRERTPLTFGLGNETAAYASLQSLYVRPVARIWARLARPRVTAS
jgi:sterol desaturase/sphingolipid hydroxylase (fatty acid hydroxylase superfamily)